MSASAIIVAGISKRFGGGTGVLALHDVTFDVPRGGSLAVVGENGSGKSTLLDVLLGMTRPSSGSVTIHGSVTSLLELGAGFFGELSGRQNAEQGALLAGLRPAEARPFADQVARFAELGAFFDQPARTYSAGMLMRLGFSVASTLPADIVVVDEVLAVGDGYFQRKCIDRLVEMRRGGATLVVASHDLHALSALCDRGLWLRAGRAEASGAVDEVLRAYEEHVRRRCADGSQPPAVSGTGEVRVTCVKLCGGDGVERSSYRTGETLRVVVDFETSAPLDSPVMGVAIFRDDGVYCYGPNTMFDGQLAGRYDGAYRLTAEFPELALLGGTYQASLAFYDRDHVYAYAWHHRQYSFTVTSDRLDHGLVLLPHRFSVEPRPRGGE